MTQSFMGSEGWRVRAPIRSHRRLPLTSWPMPGMSTRASRTIPAPRSQGAMRIHSERGRLAATLAARTPLAAYAQWRTK